MNEFYVGSCEKALINDDVYLSHDVVGGVDNYHRAENPSVFFIDEQRDICRQIIDRWGNIRNFPGIVYDEILTKEYGNHKIAPIVKFGARFGNLPHGNFLMVWTVRPDGRYWMDHDGFGAEDYEDIRLYTYIDRNGDFVSPFKLYGIGDKLYGEYAFKSDKSRSR